MTRTAIVPVNPSPEMDDAGDLMSKYKSASHTWWGMVNARPAVPDELIEEAAMQIAIAARGSGDAKTYWGWLGEDPKNRFRNMARAAARVFNGGKDE